MSNDAARFRELQELRDEQTAVAAGRQFRGESDPFASSNSQARGRDERDYDDELDGDQLNQYFGDDHFGFDATANPLVPRLKPASAESIKDPLAMPLTMTIPKPRMLPGYKERVGQPKLDAGPPDYYAMPMMMPQATPADASFFVGAGPGLGMPSSAGAAPEKQKRTRKRSSSSADKPARKAVAAALARDFDLPAPAYAQRMDMARAAADAVLDAEAIEDNDFDGDGNGDVADPGLPAPGAERLGGGLAPPMPPDIPQYRPAQSLELSRLNKLYPEPPILPRAMDDDSEDGDAAERRPEPVCFACQYGGDMVPLVCSRQFDDINRIVNSLDKPMLKRTEDIYEYYERFVRQPGNRQRRPTDPEYLEWPHRQIFQHYFTPTHGRTCARYSLEWRTNTLEMAAYTLSETNLMMEDTRTGMRVVNPAALDQFLKLNRELNLMYKVDLQKLNGVASASSAPVQNASHVLAGPNRTVGKVKSVVFR